MDITGEIFPTSTENQAYKTEYLRDTSIKIIIYGNFWVLMKHTCVKYVNTRKIWQYDHLNFGWEVATLTRFHLPHTGII